MKQKKNFSQLIRVEFFFGVLFIVFSLGIQRAMCEPLVSLNRLSFRLRADPETLDWNLAHSPVEADLLTNLMEGLVTFDEKSEVKLALAQSYSISPDGRTYVFRLKPGIRWSDGVVLKAQDFIFSWRRLLSRLLAAPYAYLLFDIEGAKEYYEGSLLDFSKVGIQALDDLTIQVKLKHPVSSWIQTLAFWATYPLREDWIQKNEGNWATPGGLLSLGPYLLQTHDKDSKFVLKKNPYYHGASSNVDEVVFHIIKSDQEAFRLYEAGQLDFLSDLSHTDLQSLGARPDLKRFSQFKTAYLSFTIDQYPTSNVKIRRAISMALDKTQLSARFHQKITPATSFIPPGLLGYSSKIGLPYDLKKAKKQIALAKTDFNLDIKMKYLLPDSRKSIIVGQWIHDELFRKLGIHLILEPLDQNSYRTQLEFKKTPVVDYSWTADIPDPHNFVSVFLSTSGNNYSNFRNPVFDSNVDLARKSLHTKTRENLYFKLQKTLLEEEVVLLPLYYEPNFVFMRPRVKNLRMNSLGYLYLRGVCVKN